jgi:hypothetical protein
MPCLNLAEYFAGSWMDLCLISFKPSPRTDKGSILNKIKLNVKINVARKKMVNLGKKTPYKEIKQQNCVGEDFHGNKFYMF